jgi:hypothetical protein
MANPFGTFQAIEFLSLGILGKLALWRALETLSLSDTRLSGIPFNELVLRRRRNFLKLKNGGWKLQEQPSACPTEVDCALASLAFGYGYRVPEPEGHSGSKCA